MTEINHVDPYLLRPIGVVRSRLKRREECPHQGWEGAPEAWLEIDPTFADGLEGIAPGSEVIVLTWFHEAQRSVLKVHPRGNIERPLRGVFSTRSPDRPNPIGLHRVEVLEIEEGTRLRICPLEALDGTPIIDIKPVLPKSADM
jgi:tRNA-Thr(GGU) m(6)t(6)A37 methyltransferase TsaA